MSKSKDEIEVIEVGDILVDFVVSYSIVPQATVKQLKFFEGQRYLEYPVDVCGHFIELIFFEMILVIWVDFGVSPSLFMIFHIA